VEHKKNNAMNKKLIIIGVSIVVLATIYFIFSDRINGWFKKDEIDPNTGDSVPSNEVLTVGSTGNDVTELQKILNKKGAKLVVDGKFGAKTEAALFKYFGVKSITLIDAKNKGFALNGLSVVAKEPIIEHTEQVIDYKPMPSKIDNGIVNLQPINGMNDNPFSYDELLPIEYQTKYQDQNTMQEYV
jgi:hypothetical protein